MLMMISLFTEMIKPVANERERKKENLTKEIHIFGQKVIKYHVWGRPINCLRAKSIGLSPIRPI